MSHSRRKKFLTPEQELARAIFWLVVGIFAANLLWVVAAWFLERIAGQ